MTAALRDSIVAAREPAELAAAAAELERAPPASAALASMLWQLLADRWRAAQAFAPALAACRRAVALRRSDAPRFVLVESLLVEAELCERLGLLAGALEALAAAVALASPLYQAAIGALRWAAVLHRRGGDEAAALRCEAQASARHERQGRLTALDWAGWLPRTWYRDRQLSSRGRWPLEFLRTYRPRRLWIVATYIELDPYVFAALGLDVVVTSWFPASVELLRTTAQAPDLPAEVARALRALPEPRPDAAPGSVRVLEHDPCEPFATDAFDVIFLFDVFQRHLSPAEFKLAARTFHRALRAGGAMFVAPLNGDGERDRFEFERLLLGTGFVSSEPGLPKHVKRLFMSYGM
jgi:tetratricopeptide (TPR) repeat protein